MEEERPMTSVPQQAEALQRILEEEAKLLAKGWKKIIPAGVQNW
jgi:hypothetical protein